MVIIISQALNQRNSSQGEFFLGGILMPEGIRDDIISTPWYSHKLHWFTPPAKWHSEVQEIASYYENQVVPWAVELMKPSFWWTALYLFFISSLTPTPASPALPCIPWISPWAAGQSQHERKAKAGWELFMCSLLWPNRTFTSWALSAFSLLIWTCVFCLIAEIHTNLILF